MKSFGMLLVLAAIAIIAVPVIAHHPAANIVDAEIYEMIEIMVDDTPHATMDLTSMGAEVTGAGVRDIEMLMEGGFLSLVSGLDGEVTVTMVFDGYKSVEMSIVQEEMAVTADKAAPATDDISLGDLKATYR